MNNNPTLPKLNLNKHYFKAVILNELPKNTIDHVYTSIKINKFLKIPNIVFQTWEDNKLGRTHLSELEKFRNMNPDYTFKFFDKTDRDNYMKDNYGKHPIYEIYTKTNFGASKVDIFRYCILLKEGGWYFDINKGVKIPLRDINQFNDEAVIAFEGNLTKNYFKEKPSKKVSKILQYPNNTIFQWGFGFKKNHPLLKNVIEDIVNDYPNYKGKKIANIQKGVLDFTATFKWTKSVWRTLDKNPDLNIRQCGIDFYRQGYYIMKRSWSRYVKSPSYIGVKDEVLVD
jgi:mannosyltransferase OCH1-like enzyme